MLMRIVAKIRPQTERIFDNRYKSNEAMGYLGAGDFGG